MHDDCGTDGCCQSADKRSTALVSHSDSRRRPVDDASLHRGVERLCPGGVQRACRQLHPPCPTGPISCPQGGIDDQPHSRLRVDFKVYFDNRITATVYFWVNSSAKTSGPSTSAADSAAKIELNNWVNIVKKTEPKTILLIYNRTVCNQYRLADII